MLNIALDGLRRVESFERKPLEPPWLGTCWSDTMGMFLHRLFYTPFHMRLTSRATVP